MPARPGDGGEFSDRLKAIAGDLERSGESDWANRVVEVMQQISHLGYGEGAAAESARRFARSEMESLAASPASAGSGVGPQLVYALGWISWLERPRPGKKHMKRADRFPAQPREKPSV
jgi:hypothetical protein